MLRNISYCNGHIDLLHMDKYYLLYFIYLLESRPYGQWKLLTMDF